MTVGHTAEVIQRPMSDGSTRYARVLRRTATQAVARLIKADGTVGDKHSEIRVQLGTGKQIGSRGLSVAWWRDFEGDLDAALEAERERIAGQQHAEEERRNREVAAAVWALRNIEWGGCVDSALSIMRAEVTTERYGRMVLIYTSTRRAEGRPRWGDDEVQVEITAYFRDDNGSTNSMRSTVWGAQPDQAIAQWVAAL
jgi:hypothetical protein